MRRLYSWTRGYLVWEAANAEEMPRERAIACDGKLPVKDPFVSLCISIRKALD